MVQYGSMINPGDSRISWAFSLINLAGPNGIDAIGI